MIPLATSSIPDSHSALREAIIAGCTKHGLPAGQVVIEGGSFPEAELLKVDLTGASFSKSSGQNLANAIKRDGPAEAKVQVKRFELRATPFYFESTPIRMETMADDCSLAIGKSKAEDLVLTLRRAAAGTLDLAARVTDLEKLAHSFVVKAGAEKGVEIKETRLEMSSLNPREIIFRAEVTAKMFIMSAKVRISGHLQVDEELNAHLSQLTCEGDGMIASAANAMLKPHFKKLENRKFPLMTFSLGKVTLRDVTLAAGESLQLHATFAG